VKIGLYGGTFDPIHKGHILPVREALRTLGLDKVLYLPTAEPPHKSGQVVASAQARFTMVELALLWEPGMMVSTAELDRSGPTYTVDTLTRFRQAQPDDDFVLLVGSDAFASFDTWRSWQRILELAEIAILMRPGWERERLSETLSAALLDAIESGRAHYLNNRPVTASSSELRRQVAAGSAPSPIPRLVLDYLRKYDLYR
jgi:nicotinate-nucleotide adenylyltransferase